MTFSATDLPPGLTINSSTGLISGTLSNAADQGSVYLVTRLCIKRTWGVWGVSVGADLKDQFLASPRMKDRFSRKKKSGMSQNGVVKRIIYRREQD